MVRTGGTRGHGSGRAKSAEAERERRAKIRTAVLLRKRRIRVRVVTGYRLTGARALKSRDRYHNYWNYQVGKEYRLYVDPDISGDADAIRLYLDMKYPIRQHFNVRVEPLEES
jgi:hypothetical protein